MSKLFSSLKIRELNFKNRIFVSPMCQYSAPEGVAQDWHLVHLGSRAVGGAALVMAEATAVSPEGRISPGDLGIWNDQQMQALIPVTDFIKKQNSVPAIQLAHAGRKASNDLPWRRHQKLPQDQAWTPVAPSPILFDQNSYLPHEMEKTDFEKVAADFLSAAKRSLQAGFQVIEIHMAHGYLLNEFLSPLANQRTDEYGGSFENRIRFPLQIAESLRKFWPAQWPVFVRISASDWHPQGWTISDSIRLCAIFKNMGIDLIDCSSGGMVPDAKVVTGPGYQVTFSEQIRKQNQILTGAVGMITDPHQAEEILQNEKADVLLIARKLLYDPYWPLHAAQTLGADLQWPLQYERGKNSH